MTSKELKALRRQAIEQGWTIIEGRKHDKWMPPSKDRPFVTVAKTPSDHRAIKNITAMLRRSGLRV